MGQTERSDPRERWCEHLECAKGTRRQRLYTAMRHHGVEQFEFTPWERQVTLEELDEAEKFWIAFFRSWDEAFGYNQTMGGQWGRLTPDGRRHLSEINKGERNPFHGKHHSDAAKKAIGEAAKQRMLECHPTKGRSLSDDHKRRQSCAMAKRWADTAYKERLRQKHREVQRTVPRSKLSQDDVDYVLQSLNNGDRANDIAEVLKISPSMITRIKQGKYTPCASK